MPSICHPSRPEDVSGRNGTARVPGFVAACDGVTGCEGRIGLLRPFARPVGQYPPEALPIVIDPSIVYTDSLRLPTLTFASPFLGTARSSRYVSRESARPQGCLISSLSPKCDYNFFGSSALCLMLEIGPHHLSSGARSGKELPDALWDTIADRPFDLDLVAVILDPRIHDGQPHEGQHERKQQRVFENAVC